VRYARKLSEALNQPFLSHTHAYSSASTTINKLVI